MAEIPYASHEGAQDLTAKVGESGTEGIAAELLKASLNEKAKI